MSAIWGHIEFDKEISTVSTMADEYKRKCKLDKISEVHFKNAIIGVGLQYINVEDELEEMPYILNDGNTVIVADVILDNRKELYEELGANGDITEIPDGKMICLSFEKWGYSFVEHLKGIYSIAIYDASSQELFICTDRTSSRCLYYYKKDNSITFSTLIFPIRKLFKDISVNEMYMKDFLILPGIMPNISSNETPWNGIYMVEAGCSVSITRDHLSINRYYCPKQDNLSKDINKLKDMFLSTYHNATKRAVRTNKDVAIALSGGFDSSSVAAMAAPILGKENKNLYSYTYVPHYNVSSYYPKRQITDESYFVKEISKMYPNIETIFTDNGGKGCFDYIDEIIDIMEIPFKAFVNLPLLLEIYKSASEKGCKVFLNGQTGNSTVSFGDIDAAINYLCSGKRYLTAFKYFNNFCKVSGYSRKKAFPIEIDRLVSQKKKSFIQTELEEDDINPFVNKKLLGEYSLVQRNNSGMSLVKDSPILTVDKMKYEVYTLPALSYIGAMETKLGLYTGIVIRDPTRDSDIIDFTLSFPFEYFSYNGIPRYLIRGFMEEMLPRSILYPIDKTGIQSADWIFRLSDSKDSILEILENTFNDAYEEQSVNMEEIETFLKEKRGFNKENEIDYLYLIIVYIYARFKMLQL